MSSGKIDLEYLDLVYVSKGIPMKGPAMGNGVVIQEGTIGGVQQPAFVDKNGDTHTVRKGWWGPSLNDHESSSAVIEYIGSYEEAKKHPNLYMDAIDAAVNEGYAEDSDFYVDGLEKLIIELVEMAWICDECGEVAVHKPKAILTLSKIGTKSFFSTVSGITGQSILLSLAKKSIEERYGGEIYLSVEDVLSDHATDILERLSHLLDYSNEELYHIEMGPSGNLRHSKCDSEIGGIVIGEGDPLYRDARNLTNN